MQLGARFAVILLLSVGAVTATTNLAADFNAVDAIAQNVDVVAISSQPSNCPLWSQSDFSIFDQRTAVQTTFSRSETVDLFVMHYPNTLSNASYYVTADPSTPLATGNPNTVQNILDSMTQIVASYALAQNFSNCVKLIGATPPSPSGIAGGGDAPIIAAAVAFQSSVLGALTPFATPPAGCPSWISSSTLRSAAIDQAVSQLPSLTAFNTFSVQFAAHFNDSHPLNSTLYLAFIRAPSSFSTQDASSLNSNLDSMKHAVVLRNISVSYRFCFLPDTTQAPTQDPTGPPPTKPITASPRTATLTASRSKSTSTTAAATRSRLPTKASSSATLSESSSQPVIMPRNSVTHTRLGSKTPSVVPQKPSALPPPSSPLASSLHLGLGLDSTTTTVVVSTGYGSVAVASALSPTIGNKASVSSRLLSGAECTVFGGQDLSSFPQPDDWSLMPGFVVASDLGSDDDSDSGATTAAGKVLSTNLLMSLVVLMTHIGGLHFK